MDQPGRSRRAGPLVVAAMLGAAAVAVGLVWWRTGSDDLSAAGTPAVADSASAASTDAPGPSRVLPPMCGNPMSVDLPPPYDDPRDCPQTLPTGRNVGLLSGVHLVRDVVLDIPAPGWTARSLGLFDGIELTTPGGNGLTLVTYPVLGPDRDSLPGTELRDALADRDTAAGRRVRLLDSGTTPLAGWPATWMDVTPRTDAATTDDCRLVAPCLPLLSLMLKTDVVAVELSPDVVSRLVVEDGNQTGVQVAAWIHDLDGPDAPAIARVLADLELSNAYEPAPPASASASVTG